MTSFKESKVGKVAIDVATSSIYAFFMLYRFCEDQADKIRNMRTSPPKQEDNPAPARTLTFKEQLDREAMESRAHENNGGDSVVKTLVDKISHVIPATVPAVGGSNPDGKVESQPETSRPHRPEDDAQIEEFVREQHRSNNADVLSSGRA